MEPGHPDCVITNIVKNVKKCIVLPPRNLCKRHCWNQKNQMQKNQNIKLIPGLVLTYGTKKKKAVTNTVINKVIKQKYNLRNA